MAADPGPEREHDDDDDFERRFSGIARLYGADGLARLRAARVAVIGVGGVGSWVAEGLARWGVGATDLVDLDDVCVTNANRQLHALDGTVGQPKVEAMAARVRAISPTCRVNVVHDFFTARSAASVVTGELSWVVDAIDGVANKALLVARCREVGVPVVVVGGAGGRRDPTRVTVRDLAESGGDGLLRRLRKVLRTEHGLAGKGPWGLPCVFSDEPQVFPSQDGGVCERREEGGRTLRLDCATGYGTASFVTGVFGLVASSVVVEAVALGRGA